MEYIKVCSTVANKINKSRDASNYDVNDEMVNEYTRDPKEDHVLLKVLTEVQKQTVDKNQNLIESEIKEVVSKLLEKPENDVSGDVISQVSKNERLIRSLLDIISENNVPKKEIKVFEINLTNALMADEVDNHLASAAIYPIDVDYNIAVKSVDNVDDELKKKSFKITQWDAKKSDFPSDVTLTNVVVVKDSPELYDLQLDNFVQELYDCVNTRGFMISVFRYRMTEPEQALNAISESLS